MSEIYIPTHLVPEEILNQLKDIAQRLHNDSFPAQSSLPLSSSTPSSSSPSLSFSPSGNIPNIPVSLSKNYHPSLEHVSVGEVTSLQQDVTTEQGVTGDNMADVAGDGYFEQSTHLLNTTVTPQPLAHEDSEVVRTSTPECSPPQTETNEMNDNDGQSQPTSPSVTPLLHSPSLQTSPPCAQSLASDRVEHPLHPSSVSGPHLPHLTPSSACTADQASFMTSRLHQPLTCAAETASSSTLTPSKIFKNLSVSDSSEGVGGKFVSSARSPSSFSSQYPSGSAKEETVRVFPPRFATSSEDVSSRNPDFLTPPETPERERKRGVPEIFTFDDLACAQERFRQTVERLRHLQERHSHHGCMFVPGHPSSLPATPSYRFLDCPSSAPPFPSYRPSPSSMPWRVYSPSLSLQPQHHPQPQTQPRTKSAAVSSSPLSHAQSKLPFEETQPLKNTAEVASSPSTPLQSPRSFKEIHQPRKKTTEAQRSPRTSAQSAVSSEQVPSQYWESSPSTLHNRWESSPSTLHNRWESSPSTLHNRWNSRAESFPHVTPDHCLHLSGSPNVFSFPDYPISVSHFGRSGSGNQNLLGPSEEHVLTRVASAADCQDARGKYGEKACDSRHLKFREPSTPYETLEFHSQLGLQDSGHILKKGKFDLREDGTREVPLCACAIMERNLLQMAESAYKWLRRLDTSLEDFERFRMELAHTNEKLRQSMDILKHIRVICDHRK